MRDMESDLIIKQPPTNSKKGMGVNDRLWIRLLVYRCILWWNTHKYRKFKLDAIWNDKRFIFVNHMKLSFGNQRFICVTKTTKKGKLYMFHLDVLEKLQYIQCNLKWKYNNRSNINLLLFEIYQSLAIKYSKMVGIWILD